MIKQFMLLMLVLAVGSSADDRLAHNEIRLLSPENGTTIYVPHPHLRWQKEAGATPAKAPWELLAETESPAQWRIEGQGKDAKLLEQAIAYAKNSGSVSTSGIQRHLRISYPRAARLMEQMEKMGLVEPQVSAGRKRRVILGGDEDN